MNKEDLDSYLDQATVGVVPMKDNFYNRYLTAPMKLFDYLAKGVPIVATDLPSSREFLDSSNSLLYPAGNIHALAEALSSIIYQPELRDRLARGAHEKAHQCTWEIRAKKLVKLFSE